MEVNVVTGSIPYLDVKGNRYDGISEMHAGFNINYCPMCGRRLTNEWHNGKRHTDVVSICNW